MDSRQVNHFEVHQLVVPVLDAVGDYPPAGTPAWCLLGESDPRKWAAVLDAGRHWALRVDCEQTVRAEASRAVAESADWSAVARGVRRRSSGLYIARKRVTT